MPNRTSHINTALKPTSTPAFANASVGRHRLFAVAFACTVVLTSCVAQATANLENTYWKLTHLGDVPVIAGEKLREPHLVLRSQDQRVGGSSGCNRLMGGYAREGEALAFSRLAGTRMACAEGMDTEQQFLAVLEQTKTWKIVGGHLELFDAGGRLLARFEARDLQ
jgi:heat shock protein HslJ